MYYHMPPEPNDMRQFNIPGLLGNVFGFPPGGGSSQGQPPMFFPPSSGGSYPWPPQSGTGPPQQPPPQMGGTFPGSQDGGPPSSPPPPFQPTQAEFQTFAIDPGAIRGCLFRFTYVWLHNDSFWFYPVFIGRRSVAGYRWSRNRWVYFGIDLEHIQSFQCF